MVSFRLVKSVQGVHSGRAFVLMARTDDTEPRLQRVGWGSTQPFFGVDVSDWDETRAKIIPGSSPGHVDASLSEVAAGRYYVQPLLDVYTFYNRSDGHQLWAPHVGWEGRVFTKTPGNLFGKPEWIDFDPESSESFLLELDSVIPPVQIPEDTRWVERFRIRSDALSEFWGTDMELGAVVLLPPGYHDQPDREYPVVYLQNHFSLDAPLGFPDRESASMSLAETNEIQVEAQTYHETQGHTETPDEFYELWTSGAAPKCIVVTFQHPNPWFDSSHAVDSDNAGPFGKAIFDELIPEFERRYRAIKEPWARVLTGGSTGGWTSLALQVLHPEFFGGAWVLFPDSVDFRRMVLSDIYSDESVFYARNEDDADRDHRLPSQEWLQAERPFRRTVEGQVHVTFREMARLESIVATRARSGLQLHPWMAIFGPVGDDGYPVPLWDEETGVIDRDVAEHWRSYDMSDYIRKNWESIGPELVGKLHFSCGDMDNYYLNTALYLLEDFLESTENPKYEGSFNYARPKEGHYHVPWRHLELLEIMSEHMAHNAPAGTDMSWRE